MGCQHNPVDCQRGKIVDFRNSHNIQRRVMYRSSITVTGRLTAMPEIRTTPKGKRVAQFSVAQNYRAGEEEFGVNYFECEAWDPFVKHLENGGEKGRPIFVEGRIKTDRWTDEKSGGRKMSKQRLVVEHFHFIDLLEVANSEAKEGPSDEELDHGDANE